MIKETATGLSVLALLAATGGATALPPFTVSYLYQSGSTIPNVGLINSPFFTGGNGGDGFKSLGINNSGTALVHVGVYASPGFNQAVLKSTTGLNAYLAAGAESPDPGSVTVPSIEYVMNEVYGASINNAGTAGFALKLGPDSFSSVTPLTGVYFNKAALPIQAGDPVTALGVAPGTTFAPFTAAGSLALNDSNVYLLGTRIVENGVTKNALLKLQVDASGSQLSQTLVAKEGGPVGAGPDTWASLPVGPHTCAMNAAGTVLFSGQTAGGTDGVFLNGAFVATAGGPAPGGGTWGPLAGVPLDLSNTGQFAFRGTLGGTGVWTETAGDAGETFATANGTAVGGPLERIVGALSDEHDVDLYLITVGDPTLLTQTPFSATTVPGPGFPGAAFDSVLYLLRTTHNFNGNTRTGLGRSDDAAVGVPQSTLTAASLQSSHTPGTQYYLAVSTPKARAMTGTDPTRSQIWQDDPGSLAITGGVVHWADPGEGQIRRLDTATGAELPPLQVSVTPPQTTGQITGDGRILDAMLAVHDAGAASKLYFLDKAFGAVRIRRCNTDGSAVEDVVSTGSPNAFNTLAMTVDSVGGKLYWSKLAPDGTIHAANLDGTAPTTVQTLTASRATALAVDGAGSMLYWYEPTEDAIKRSAVAGGAATLVASGAAVRAMTVDAATRTLIWSTTTGQVRTLPLNPLGAAATLVTTEAPGAVAVDTSGRVYWSASNERLIRRAPLSGGPVESWRSVGADVGERPADGPGYLSPLGTPPWQKNGAAGAGPLPYQIALTGVTAATPLVLIARNNTQKVVATLDVLPQTSPNPITVVGSATGPVKISDRGVVAWRGRWSSSGTRTGLFLDRDLVFTDNTVPVNGGAALGTMRAGVSGFDMSDSGQHLVASAVNGSFVGSSDNCVTVSFASVPGCAADFNADGVVNVADIFAFLSAWFAQAPGSDFNNSGATDVADIFAFLSAWFAGCP